MVLKQHLIDPEICIRCNTCEATCPVGAVSHDDVNYVVDAAKCHGCLDCIAPCPTGSIDHWVMVEAPFSLTEQFGWTELPALPEVAGGEDGADPDAAALLAAAHAAVGGAGRAPASAARPQVHLFRRERPAMATLAGNFRITGAETESDVRHLILDFGATALPVLEGQSIGVFPPGEGPGGRTHAMRLYSVASPRDGEKPGANNLSLTVKRVPGGVASTWLCDLPVGAQVPVVGPFGTSFLMPEDTEADIIMICTGTGAAPFRGFTERRRRLGVAGSGKLHLFFGARTPRELPYFGPLQKVPAEILAQHLVFSRLPGQRRDYVQDRMRAQAAGLAGLLAKPKTHVFICGLRGLEAGTEAAFADIAAGAGLDWPALRAAMLEEGRFHAETY